MKAVALWLCLGAAVAVFAAMSGALLGESRRRRLAARGELAWMLLAALIALGAALPSIRCAGGEPSRGHGALPGVTAGVAGSGAEALRAEAAP